MQESPLMGELAIVGAAAVLAALILHRLRLPSIVGFLAAGAVLGPSGVGLVRNQEDIRLIAEVGVILLLFGIGLEFSLSRLRYIWRPVIVGGTLQVGLTTAATLGILLTIGVGFERALLFGFVAALSSTAIVLRTLQERAELDAPHGQLIVGTLILQDLLVVPLTLLIPVLAGEDGNPAVDIARALGLAALVIVATVALARFAIPRFFALVDATRSREVFLLAVLSVGLGAAWSTGELGLSVALGAFLAGVVVADTDYSHRAITDVIPLRDAFTSIFFVSLGMLFDVEVIRDRPVAVLLILVGLVAGKGVIAAFSALVLRYPARPAWISGVTLAQFGEFGFVLLTIGEVEGLVLPDEARLFVTAGVTSMVISRVLMGVAPHLRAGEQALRPLECLLRARGADDLVRRDRGLSDHIVVVGYGVAGRLLASALRRSDIPHLVVELDAERVRRGRAAGAHIYYGDITSPEVLRHAGVTAARAIVLLINDPAAVRRAIGAARDTCPDTPLIVRTRYVADRDELHELGATEVICEELEGAAEITAHVLGRLDVESDRIRGLVLDALEASGQRDLTRGPTAWLRSADAPAPAAPPGETA